MSTIREFVNQVREGLLSPLFILDNVRRYGRVVISVPQGFGKSHGIRKTLTSDSWISSGYLDIVICAENNRVIKEYYDELSAHSKKPVVWIKGRTDDNCLHFKEMHSYQESGFFLNAQRVCTNCKERCEYKKSRAKLKRIQKRGGIIVLVTQQMLMKSPTILDGLQSKYRLLIADEPGILRPQVIELKPEQIKKHLPGYLKLGKHNYEIKRLALALLHLQKIGTENFDRIELQPLSISSENNLLSARLQNLYNFLKTLQIAVQKDTLNQRDPKDFRVAEIPNIQCDMAIFAMPVKSLIVNTIFPGINAEEVTLDRVPPTPTGTRLIRINSSLGAKNNFEKNSEATFRFFAVLVAERVFHGKRGILISKVEYLEDTIAGMNRAFEGLEVDLKCIKYAGKIPVDEDVIPVITFGASGFNDFEKYDFCYTVMTYNANASVIREHWEYCHRFLRNQEFTITTTERDRRISGLLSTKDRELAEALLELNEIQIILQAIGRIRPFTNESKEVIIIYRGDLGIGEEVFQNFEDLRQEFNLPTYKEAQLAIVQNQVKRLILEGKAAKEISRIIDLPLSTTYRIMKGVERATE